MAGRHGIVSAEASADLRAAMRGLDRAPHQLRALIMDTSRAQLSGAWTQELGASPATRPQQRFITGGAHTIPMSNGLIARTGNHMLTRAYEFGVNNRDEYTQYTRQGATVRRRTKRQLPARNAGGWVAYPAANRLGSRVFKMWGALINKVLHDAYEGRT